MSEDNVDIERLQAALEGMEGRRRSPGAPPAKRWALGFESTLEHDFSQYRIQSALPLIRLSIALACVLYVVFLGYDAWLGDSVYQHGWIYPIVLGWCLPPNLLLFWCAGSIYSARWTNALAVLAAATNAFGLTLAVTLSYRQGVPLPYEVIGLQLLYDFFLLGIAWRVAAPVALATLAMFVLGLAAADLPSRIVFERTFYLTALALLGSIGCYLQERTQRQSWLRAQLLRELSEHDSLTGLYNHRVFYERAGMMLRQAQRDRVPVAVLLVDVDHFKRFNDQYGHLVGDECLRLVAAALRKLARRPLDVAARVGGEEFALMFYNAAPEWALARAEDLRAAVRGLSLASAARISVSVGVAAVSADQDAAGVSLEAVIGRADRALYRAKDSGRDRVMLEP